MQSVIVRRASEADWQSLLAIERECFGAHGYSRYFLRMAPVLADLTLLVAEEDGAGIVGYCLGALESPERSWLMSVAVRPSAAGRGIGSALCRELIVRAEAAGVTSLRLTVAPGSAAERLYRRLGFRDVVIDDDFYGDQQPRLVMALSLAEPGRE